MSIKQYNKMLKKQDYKCAICRTLNSGNKIFKHLSVDHDQEKVESLKSRMSLFNTHFMSLWD